MRTVFTNELIGKGTFEDMFENRITANLFQILIDLVSQGDKKVERVLLLAHINLLTPHAKRLPERLRYAVLELTLFEVREHVLQLPKDARLSVYAI